MDLYQAIEQRHSVRKYSEKAIEPEKIALLRDEIGRCNDEGGLNIQLVTDEPRAFAAGILKYGSFSGVRNYFVMAAQDNDAAKEKVGYFGERLVLLAQTLGLNTCWVGLTYKKVEGVYKLAANEVVHCVISLGYGESEGKQHPLKPIENFIEAEWPVPTWFRKGVEAALLAPTAVNQQKFKFILHPDKVVEAKSLFSIAGFTKVDLGIVKYHFEVAAGKENFTWFE